ERLERDLREAESAERGLVAAVDEAEARRASAQAAADEAESARRHAETEHRALLARVEALTLALEAASPAAAPAALGVLSDLVEIDGGWETSVVAALGDTLGALVVEDADGARAAPASPRLPSTIRERGRRRRLNSWPVPRRTPPKPQPSSTRRWWLRPTLVAASTRMTADSRPRATPCDASRPKSATSPSRATPCE